MGVVLGQALLLLIAVGDKGGEMGLKTLSARDPEPLSPYASDIHWGWRMGWLDWWWMMVWIDVEWMIVLNCYWCGWFVI